MRKPSLTSADVAGIALCWAGAATTAYFVKHPVVGLICVIAAYYLSKWIILKEED